MILNLSKIKTEALLLFCKDIIQTYKDSNTEPFELDVETKKHITQKVDELLKALNSATKPHEFYIQNAQKSFHIQAIIKSYEFLNEQLNRALKKEHLFSPTMLCFSLLASWFAELQKESKSKEYIYFIIYPYALIYDELLVHTHNKAFKALNTSMIEVAERVILSYEKYRLK
jgi:hypothetical protein